MKLFFTISAFIILFVVCGKSQESKPDKISKYNTIIYALPKTILNLKIDVVKTQFRKGIFAEYAEKYLGITQIPTKDSVYYSLGNCEITTSIEPDPQFVYSLTFKNIPENLQYLLTLNHNINISELNEVISGNANDNELQNIRDPYLINDRIKEHTDTFYKTILSDTSFIKIPVFKKQLIAKNFEELAKETAHELIKTRKRKMKLIRGEYDFHPEGDALRIMIDELNRQEREYLALFTGFQTQNIQTITYNLSQFNTNSTIICSFNKSSGITEELSNSENVVLQLTSDSDSPLSTLKSAELPDNKNQFFYRVPNYCNLKLTLGKSILYKGRIHVFQLGTIRTFPINTK